MTRELLILRHAKSDWDSGAASDFDRPLAKRGRKAAPRIGRYMREEGLQPELAICSPAVRARQTLHLVLAELAEEPEVRFVDSIYGADPGELVAILSEVPGALARVLLVGHNPGFSMLLARLAGVDEHMPTAALARLSMPDDWTDLPPSCAALESLVLPRELSG